MRKILAASICFVSLAVHAATVPVEPVRVMMLNDNAAPAKGDRLAFQGGADADDCRFYGIVGDAGKVAINRMICPDNTATKVSMVVPLERKKSFVEALNTNVVTDWLAKSSRNYYLFPASGGTDEN